MKKNFLRFFLMCLSIPFCVGVAIARPNLLVDGVELVGAYLDEIL
jgi:hypothetical protein